MEKIVSVVLVVLAVVLALIPSLSAGHSWESPDANRGHHRDQNREHGHDCSEWTFGPCVLDGGKTCGRGMKQGTRTGQNCRHTERQFACKVKCAADHQDEPDSTKCRYKVNREQAKATPCNEATGKKSVTLNLVRGDSSCPSTKVVERNCGHRADRGHHARDAEHHGRDTEHHGHGAVDHGATADQHRCRYMRGSWSECDATTDTRKRTLTLKPGSPSDCEATKEVTRPCKKSKRDRSGREHRRSE